MEGSTWIKKATNMDLRHCNIMLDQYLPVKCVATPQLGVAVVAGVDGQSRVSLESEIVRPCLNKKTSTHKK